MQKRMDVVRITKSKARRTGLCLAQANEPSDQLSAKAAS
jgi:hypothetical protein